MAPTKKDIFASISLDAGVLAKQVDGLLASTKGLASAIQVTLVGLAVHTAINGNVAMLNKLDEGIGTDKHTPIHRASLRAWVCKNGPCGWDSKNKKFTYSKDKAKAIAAAYEADADGTVAGLAQLPWYEARKEQDEFSGFDLTKTLERLVKRCEQLMEDHPDMVGDKVNIDFLPQLKIMIANGPARRIKADNDDGRRLNS